MLFFIAGKSNASVGEYVHVRARIEITDDYCNHGIVTNYSLPLIGMNLLLRYYIHILII